jgi:tetratricopeptide (TPR) repeat protein
LLLRGDVRRMLAIANHPGADTLLPLAEADLRTSLSARPDFARAWYALSDVYFRQARFADAARAAKRAFEADAFLGEIRSVISTLFIASLNNEQFDEARLWCRQGIERDRMDPRFADCEVTLLGYSGRRGKDASAAWDLIRQIEGNDSTKILEATWGYRRLMVAAVLARAGRMDSARAVLRRMKADEGSHAGSAPTPTVEAYVHLLLGDTTRALAILDQRLTEVPRERAYVARSPWFRALRANPRFQSLVVPVT